MFECYLPQLVLQSYGSVMIRVFPRFARFLDQDQMSIGPALRNCDGAYLPAPIKDSSNSCGRKIGTQPPGRARWVSRWDRLTQWGFQ